ncbi:apolipoprotein C-II-like [Mustelus asterias]
MRLYVLTLAALFITPCCCALIGASLVMQPDAEEGFSHTLEQFWNSFSTGTTDWFRNVSASPTAQYLKDAFNNGTAAINTYTRILIDQLVHSV